MARRFLTLRIPSDLEERVGELARQRGISVSELVREMLEQGTAEERFRRIDPAVLNRSLIDLLEQVAS